MATACSNQTSTLSFKLQQTKSATYYCIKFLQLGAPELQGSSLWCLLGWKSHPVLPSRRAHPIRTNEVVITKKLIWTVEQFLTSETIMPFNTLTLNYMIYSLYLLQTTLSIYWRLSTWYTGLYLLWTSLSIHWRLSTWYTCLYLPQKSIDNSQVHDIQVCIYSEPH